MPHRDAPAADDGSSLNGTLAALTPKSQAPAALSDRHSTMTDRPQPNAAPLSAVHRSIVPNRPTVPVVIGTPHLASPNPRCTLVHPPSTIFGWDAARLAATQRGARWPEHSGASRQLDVFNDRSKGRRRRRRRGWPGCRTGRSCRRRCSSRCRSIQAGSG